MSAFVLRGPDSARCCDARGGGCTPQEPLTPAGSASTMRMYTGQVGDNPTRLTETKEFNKLRTAAVELEQNDGVGSPEGWEP